MLSKSESKKKIAYKNKIVYHKYLYNQIKLIYFLFNSVLIIILFSLNFISIVLITTETLQKSVVLVFIIYKNLIIFALELFFKNGSMRPMLIFYLVNVIYFLIKHPISFFFLIDV